MILLKKKCTDITQISTAASFPYPTPTTHMEDLLRQLQNTKQTEHFLPAGLLEAGVKLQAFDEHLASSTSEQN